MSNNAESEIVAKSLEILNDSLRRRNHAVTQYRLLELKLENIVRRLKCAHKDSKAAFQYTHGTACLVIWELQQLYREYGNRHYGRAHRNAVRIRYLNEPENRRLYPVAMRTQMWEEFHSYVVDGIDPEDHYTQEDEQFPPNSQGGSSSSHSPDGATTEVDEQEVNSMIFPEKLHCFLAWDVYKRFD